MIAAALAAALAALLALPVACARQPPGPQQAQAQADGGAPSALSLLGAARYRSLPAVATGARLAANCAACHGANGVTEGAALPVLAGQGKGQLLVTLKAFKSGARPGTIMPQIAKGYTDEQLAQLAEFLAAQPPIPAAALLPEPHLAAAGSRP